MAKRTTGKSFASRTWHFVRWPFVIVFLIIGAAVFLVGVAQNTGYMGTTSAQPVKESDPLWKEFKNLDGTIFTWQYEEHPSVSNGVVNLDSRVIKALLYLTKKSSAKCGVDQAHESLQLSVDSTALTDLSYPPTNPAPPSTIRRGVGVRIVAADKIKCVKIPTNGEPPTVFDRLDIPFDSSASLIPDKPYDGATNEVKCAVGYFPVVPVDADPSESIPPQDNNAYKELNTPPVFDYADIETFAHRAAVYKMAQLTYQLMHIDDAGCYKSVEQKGSDRLIPNTVILPLWIESSLYNVRNRLFDDAKVKFPFSFQKASPLAGLSMDDKLDYIGLHFNY